MFAQRAADLARQMLVFSRKQVMQPRVLDLNVVLADTESMLRRLIGEDVDLVVRPGPDLGPVLARTGVSSPPACAIGKPFTSDVLARAIHDALTGPSSAQLARPPTALGRAARHPATFPRRRSTSFRQVVEYARLAA